MSGDRRPRTREYERQAAGPAARFVPSASTAGCAQTMRSGRGVVRRVAVSRQTPEPARDVPSIRARNRGEDDQAPPGGSTAIPTSRARVNWATITCRARRPCAMVDATPTSGRALLSQPGGDARPAELRRHFHIPAHGQADHEALAVWGVLGRSSAGWWRILEVKSYAVRRVWSPLRRVDVVELRSRGASQDGGGGTGISSAC